MEGSGHLYIKSREPYLSSFEGQISFKGSRKSGNPPCKLNLHEQSLTMLK